MSRCRPRVGRKVIIRLSHTSNCVISSGDYRPFSDASELFLQFMQLYQIAGKKLKSRFGKILSFRSISFD
ncbi:hypothetical protein L2E82_36333 [Cichorium intybus]|uniref:Uncharacterized protein n=1 Tax=Cichorium intybus TaxID=13427 RepID=A0ACB9BRC4_CICIN|nr:hypothetical protein L2E82_36333 [Cichorium intybus]